MERGNVYWQQASSWSKHYYRGEVPPAYFDRAKYVAIFWPSNMSSLGWAWGWGEKVVVGKKGRIEGPD